MSFLLNMIAGILASLLIGLLSWLLARGRFAEVVGKRLAFLRFTKGRQFRERVTNSPHKAQAFFERWLKGDQTRNGHHRGQLGRGSNPKEERFFQIGREPLSLKPRLYLTGWPVFVLSERRAGKALLRRAGDGVHALLEDGLVRVAEGAIGKTPPEGNPSIVSYRHTIRALQILLTLGDSLDEVELGIGRMLDDRNGWQNPDGGWAQCDEEFTDSDLWASAYAIAFLDLALRRNLVPTPVSRKLLSEAMSATSAFLESNWRDGRWGYGLASPELNGVQIVHETAPVLRSLRPDFANRLFGWVQGWLSPSGRLSDAYNAACPEVGCCSNNARVAYALFRLGAPAGEWRPLYVAALDAFGEGVNCVDVAILLSLTQESAKDDGLASEIPS